MLFAAYYYVTKELGIHAYINQAFPPLGGSLVQSNTLTLFLLSVASSTSLAPFISNNSWVAKTRVPVPSLLIGRKPRRACTVFSACGEVMYNIPTEWC